MKPLMIATLVLFPSCAFAESQNLPDYHFEDKCRAQGKLLAGTTTGPVTEECLQTERAAYDTLKQYWPKLDEQQKVKCIGASLKEKLGNYRILQQCLSREELKADGKIKVGPKP